MPDNSRLAKLIAQRKRQEKQNDRIHVHKNKLDNMRLEKLSAFYDRSKYLFKRQHLTAEAKCIKSMEKIYARQCKIEDEKKEKQELIRQQGNEIMKAVSGEGNKDDSAEQQQRRRRITSASKQEQAKQFMNKAKSLSAGYRDNDPPQFYYKNKNLVPPERLVTPEMSYSTQAQNGGGFMMPASAFHVKNLKRWHGIPDDIPILGPPKPEPPIELKVKTTVRAPTPERQFSLIEALQASDDGNELDIVQEEDEPRSDETSQKSSSNESDNDDVAQQISIRPCTAPAPRGIQDNSDKDKAEDKTVTAPSSARDVKEGESPRGILSNRVIRRPSTALPGVSINEEGAESSQRKTVTRQSSGVSFLEPSQTDNTGIDSKESEKKRLLMRRQSSTICFSEPPSPSRRRSSVGPSLAQLHRRQSNVAAMHTSIQHHSKLLKPKTNKMKKKSGKRMGLIQSVMTNAENEILTRRLREKSLCLAAERDRRMQRAQSAPLGGRTIQLDEDYPSLIELSTKYADALADSRQRREQNRGQKILIKANRSYSAKLTERVKEFANSK